MNISEEGEAMGAKGNVYYKGFQSCRSIDISTDDRVVATLAYQLFEDAELKGYGKYSNAKKWLKDNEVLYGPGEWFMADDVIKERGYVKAEGECYKWVSERLDQEKGR